MNPNAKSCLYPRHPDEAVRVLAEKGRQALILAGGTTAALSRDPAVTTLVDLTRMGFDSVERRDGGLAIGCNLRIQQLAEHPGVQNLWNGMLAASARAVGARPLRNMITVGGNCVALFRWSDPPVALLAMGAAFELTGPDGARTLDADAFFARHPRQVLRPGEILLRVCLDEPAGKHGGAFVKYARTAFDLAVVDAAACLWFEGRVCSRARVVVGATRTVPWRAEEAEAILVGKKPTPSVLDKAARAAREATRTADDIRTSGEYRRQMVEVIVRRTLGQAVESAGKGG